MLHFSMSTEITLTVKLLVMQVKGFAAELGQTRQCNMVLIFSLCIPFLRKLSIYVVLFFV